MKYAVLLYESAAGVASRAPEHFPAHKARLDEFHARGELVMVGTFGDPQAEGSMAVFTSRTAAEEFAQGDPFVRNGVVKAYRILDWHEILTRKTGKSGE
ncbi:YciI family protein [Actinoplanes sp. CA-030573]|uniref:YciI family protein n=1 Tax=Actinoplanes sp. CA-030573 TaxID=3239898 RepID=UPI003D9291BF